MLGKLSQALLALGPLGILLMAGIDSAGIPLTVGLDAALLFLVIKQPDQAWWTATLAVLGSLAGNLALFFTARQGGKRYLDKESTGRSMKFRRWFGRYGLITVFIPAALPIPMPLKIFVISAGALGTPLWQFATVATAARVVRYFGEAWLGVALGNDAAGFLKHYAAHLILGSVILFILLYWAVRLNDRTRHRLLED